MDRYRSLHMDEGKDRKQAGIVRTVGNGRKRRIKMHIIGIEYQFEAGHYLTGLPDTHKCTRPHGHNYVVIVEFRSETLDEVGFVIDYFDARPIYS